MGAGAPVDLAAQLPVLVPRAIDWALGVAQAAGAGGVPLEPALQDAARRVGVVRADLVRLCVVDEVPLPDDPLLAQAAEQVGFTARQTSGLTLGYVVFVSRGCVGDRRLLVHEFRHVAQFEACGGIARFLDTHLRHLAAFGYADAPFEVDARAHEPR